MSDNKDYGMITKIWGPPGWLFLHTVTMGYPYEIDFLMSVLTKDKIIDRFRKYFGGKKAMNNRTASKK